MPNPQPRIRVLVPLDIPDSTPEVDLLVARFTTSTLRHLAVAGADVAVTDVSAPLLPEIADILDGIDGLLLLGGGDVDPTLYGVEGPVPNLYGVDRAADDVTIAAIRAARERDVPVLGICRGNQLINVAAGGSLIPDLPADGPHQGGEGEPMFLTEKVALEPGSWIASVYDGAQTLAVRSGHHQAIDRVGDGLRATARATDEVVEGVQAVQGWCVGVQWHPEDTDGSVEDAQRLFDAFVAECGQLRRRDDGPFRRWPTGQLS